MLGKTIIITAGFFTLGAILIAITHRLRSIYLGQRVVDWLKYIVYLLIILTVIVLAWCGRVSTAVLLALIAGGGGYELYRNLPARKLKCAVCSGVFGAFIGLCLGHLLLGTSDEWTSTFVFLLLLICITDSYSQLWGKLIGRWKLCPGLSPGKTVEGLIGGILTTIAAVYAISFLAPSFSRGQLALVAAVVAISATTGNLVFSFVKRKLGINDFSGFIPGHGGILDRFDSLIVAAPVFYWTTRLWLG